MNLSRVDNVNILSADVLATPETVKRDLPLTPELEERVFRFRESVRRILDGEERRLFAVVGPCSIHNADSALEYARRLHELAAEVADVFLLVMRVYFEKPRTSIGWKGFINDPGMDDSFDIEAGLRRARDLLLRLAGMGLPAATEALDPIVPQYIADLVTWTAIGARTTESQTHREMASGLSSPVGFKNGTDGEIAGAINALRSTLQPHHFLGITQDGRSAVFRTRGNRHAHIVLRGGRAPNYDKDSIHGCELALREAGLPVNIAVDCSHGNSARRPERQPDVLRECTEQILAGNRSLVGFMIESHLHGGRQALGDGLKGVCPDVSVTDPCLGWEETAASLLEAAERLRPILRRRERRPVQRET